jgi:hypothetical protein
MHFKLYQKTAWKKMMIKIKKKEETNDGSLKNRGGHTGDKK